MQGYKSDIDIGIGQMPEIKDNPEVFAELQLVYNALHTLNANVSVLRSRIGLPADDEEPWESFSFEGRAFWAPVDSNVRAGNLVRRGSSTWVRGVNVQTAGPTTRRTCGNRTPSGQFCSGTYAGYTATSFSVTTIDFGMALTDAEDGRAVIGWPPAIVEVTGISLGQLVYGRRDSGSIFSNAPDERYTPIGRGVAPNAVLLQHGLSRQHRYYTCFNSRASCG